MSDKELNSQTLAQSPIFRVAETLRDEIEELEEKIDRVDSHGLGILSLVKRLEQKRKELLLIESSLQPSKAL